MNIARLRRISLVWLGLGLVTVLSYSMEMLAGTVEGGLHRSGLSAILVIAFLKVRFIMLDFMELRRAPLLLRLINEVWVVAMCVVLLAVFNSVLQ